jgi:acetyl-CoA carboxylase biotin carboxyl carrier protein
VSDGGDDAARVEELLAIMREHDIDALSLEIGDRTYELVLREPAQPAPLFAAMPASATAQPQAAAAPAAGPTAKRVTAPIIGVFYRSASPGSEPFVEAGDRVTAGQVLCIIEAMKMMNEITTDYAGTVARVLPENGQLVSLGEELFWIEP